MRDNDLNVSSVVWAVATVNLPGLPAGTAARVDVRRPGISRRIAAGYLRVCTEFETDRLEAEVKRSEERGTAWQK